MHVTSFLLYICRIFFFGSLVHEVADKITGEKKMAEVGVALRQELAGQPLGWWCRCG